ncbi:MAG: hypothetical protein LBB58_02950 [Cellulomonadaceae bacterium]|nr:hypothetical protein [Cellulomonadaceae bacterium]
MNSLRYWGNQVVEPVETTAIGFDGLDLQLKGADLQLDEAQPPASVLTTDFPTRSPYRKRGGGQGVLKSGVSTGLNRRARRRQRLGSGLESGVSMDSTAGHGGGGCSGERRAGGLGRNTAAGSGKGGGGGGGGRDERRGLWIA